MSIMDDVSLQQMILIHLENMTHVYVVELYVEFEQIPYVVGAVEEIQPDFAFEGYYIDSEEEFEGNYEIHDANEEDVLEHDMKSDVDDVANALANELPFQEPFFMRVLDEETLKALEFAEDMNPGPTFVPGGEFAIGMEFNFRESVIKAVKEYTISRGVDYWVREFEPTTFYAQCVHHKANCAWLIRVSLIKRKFCWLVRRYNGKLNHQDHSKLDSDMIAFD
ncbi:hypothetical protein PIB30_022574 [Stylosanthes scabra]|uniref:Transposase MuDR plant domain-containing protein n=1 Tax=Stylosanthes scabra TaxID=79078 RepID=A0ABU6Z7H7_9FABA|nr:hypothetical protein [Stylosanthes scabra]